MTINSSESLVVLIQMIYRVSLIDYVRLTLGPLRAVVYCGVNTSKYTSLGTDSKLNS